MLFRSLDKAFLKKKRLSEDLLKAEDSNKYRLYGELLTANLHLIKPGARSVEVVNYYDDSDITIPISEKLSGSKNAQHYFKKYSKARTALKEKAVQLEEIDSDRANPRSRPSLGRTSQTAPSVIRRHRILETYLVTRLGFEWDEVHAEAEVLEHAVSERLLAALDAALGHPVRDPHGDPIPAADGRIVQPALRSIDTVGVGRTVVVGRIRDESALLRDLRRAGIGLDTPVRVVSRDSGPASGASRSRRTTTVRAVSPESAAGAGGLPSSAGAAGGPPGAAGLPMGEPGTTRSLPGASDTAEVVVPAGTL